MKKDGVEPPAPEGGDEKKEEEGDDKKEEGAEADDKKEEGGPVEVEDVMLPPNELDITACNQVITATGTLSYLDIHRNVHHHSLEHH